jgi:uncharacterized protein YdeI (YjbR/CyaY-like superfamily)
MDIGKTLYVKDRQEWRNWLVANFQKTKEIWLVFPNKASGRASLLYNDAVEEALCFGWIDSTVKPYRENASVQRFTPRNPRTSYSQPNIERLKWLAAEGKLHPSVLKVSRILSKRLTYFRRIY